ncbi:hypothetical protein AGMMS49921_04430 [Endomicrobiia bacterium]|nr:hypothetical protein AGMMS49921_04430 [Endomicrobiia bacterium]
MTDNEIIVNGGNFNDSDISGAFANNLQSNVNVNDNRVKINAGNGIRSVFGGYTRNGTASGNKVFIKNKVTIGGFVFGGAVNGNGNAESNEVTITDAAVGKDVYVGIIMGNGDAKDNKI